MLAQQLPKLKNIKIPRYYFTCKPTAIELYGFCDASEKAYSAVVYIRGIPATTNTRLVMSKSRVASLKKQTLPRLELCGTVLLTDLAFKMKEMLQLQYDISLVQLWCDSTIALSWIHTSSYKLGTFVGNRVQKIQNLSRDVIWDHVDSKSNPADCLSRGLTPQKLQNHEIWWNGPRWSRDNEGPSSKESTFRPNLNFELDFKKPTFVHNLPLSREMISSQNIRNSRSWFE